MPTTIVRWVVNTWGCVTSISYFSKYSIFHICQWSWPWFSDESQRSWLGKGGSRGECVCACVCVCWVCVWVCAGWPFHAGSLASRMPSSSQLKCQPLMSHYVPRLWPRAPHQVGAQNTWWVSPARQGGVSCDASCTLCSHRQELLLSKRETRERRPCLFGQRGGLATRIFAKPLFISLKRPRLELRVLLTGPPLGCTAWGPLNYKPLFSWQEGSFSGKLPSTANRMGTLWHPHSKLCV